MRDIKIDQEGCHGVRNIFEPTQIYVFQYIHLWFRFIIVRLYIYIYINVILKFMFVFCMQNIFKGNTFKKNYLTHWIRFFAYKIDISQQKEIYRENKIIIIQNTIVNVKYIEELNQHEPFPC